ncbi:hypothetical protein [Paraburkholderia sediminicola]|uniref:hypothetical protein n=1 Tax=Paraburkholderia sediminicola TaxID=458836 RepID=UPI0038B8BDBA
MNEQDRAGISEDELASLTTDDKRWKDVGKQFAAMNLRLSNQDVVIDSTAAAVRQIAEDTKVMRDAWNDGVAVKRFFCRLAEAWTFLLRKVFIPVVLPMVGLWAIARIVNHEALPDWINACIKLVLAIL